MEELIIVTPTDGRSSSRTEASMRSGPVRPAVMRDPISGPQTAAWRAPSATRFDGRPANDVRPPDFVARADALGSHSRLDQPIQMEPMPTWLVITIGGVVAALLGALLGGALSV